MLVENILLMALWTLGEQVTDVSHQVGWDRDDIFVAVSVSFFLGLVFMVIYYKYFHVRKIAASLSLDKDPEKTTPSKPQHSTSYSSSDDPAVTVFNCALNPAIRKKKKMPSRSVPPLPSSPSTVPFWKEPLPVEERTAGDGLSYSRTTSVDDIRQKLQEKKEKQMMELRRIEDDIAAGRLERPSAALGERLPIPGVKRQPVVLMGEEDHWGGGYHDGGVQYDRGQ